MRSLKECYEIAKQYHMYWNNNSSEYYMCIAAVLAAKDGALSDAEAALIEQDAMSLVKALDQFAISIRYALRDVHKETLADHDRVKAYWDMYIDNMENQDG